jgi:hypothetical protein
VRRRPTSAVLAALCSLALVLAGCGGDDGDDDTDGSTTTTEADGPTTTTPQAEDAEVDCDAYRTVIDLIERTEEIATGSSDGQAAADDALTGALEALAPSAEGDEFVTEALDTLGRVSFQVTDDAEEGPSQDEVQGAVVTIEDAWGAQCADPAAEGTTVPEGTETPDGTEGEATAECPSSPEVLEAEGFSCDSEGNLTPLDEETEGECPSPEVLEAEGFTCDSEGNLTPIEGTDDGAPSEETTVPEE